MTIQSASAALTAQSQMIAITGYIEYQQGFLDPETNTIRALSQSTWRALEDVTWSELSSFSGNPLPILWSAPILDLGIIDFFTLNIETQAAGLVSLEIFVSETGLFAGEEQAYYLEEGQNVAAFYGQYVAVNAKVQGDELSRLTINSSRETIDIELRDIDTSTLPGTVNARQLPLTASAIVDIVIQPKAVTPYPVNLYVSAQPTSEIVIPLIRNKQLGTIALYGIDNDPRDAVIDARVKIMPIQRLFNGNLVVVN
jgi:hypothetical protein